MPFRLHPSGGRGFPGKAGCPGPLAALPSEQPRKDRNDPDPHFAPLLSVCVCSSVLGEPGLWLLTSLSAAREVSDLPTVHHPRGCAGTHAGGAGLAIRWVKSLGFKIILPPFPRVRFNLDFPDPVGALGCGCSARHHPSNLLFASHEVSEYFLSCNDISFYFPHC